MDQAPPAAILSPPTTALLSDVVAQAVVSVDNSHDTTHPSASIDNDDTGDTIPMRSKRVRANSSAAALSNKKARGANVREPMARKAAAISAPSAGRKGRRSVVTPVAATSSSTPLLPTAAPANAPPWLTNTVSMMSSGNLGLRWTALLQAWVAFEEQHHYTGTTKLGTTSRPAAVGCWIQCARSAAYRPQITDFRSYEAMHLKWWLSLQPDWRLGEDEDVLNAVDGDWGELKKPGINGLVSILASLFFWGSGMAAAGKKAKHWDSAVEDMITMFSHLV